MQMLSNTRLFLLSAMLAGCVLDLLIGDPHFLYHPVRLIGSLISVLEKRIRRRAGKNKWKLRMGGIMLFFSVTAATVLTVWTLMWGMRKVHPAAGWITVMLLDYWLFAARSLRSESMKVYRQLKKGDLAAARKAVGMIVGRDTDRLNEAGVTKAAVETIAENTADGVIAPLIYTAIGGPVLGWLYKSINTLDSMVGYKDMKYRYIGWFSAKADDIANFIPARLCALIMIAVSPLVKLNAANARKIFVRDRHNHASPNSAQTEAVMAGALDVQLAGDAWYFGKLYRKQTIGDDNRPIEIADIKRANRLMYATGLATVLVCTLLTVAAVYLTQRM